jgi:putative ABC transport system permease protein
MFTNYLKTTLRNLWRRKGYTAINVLGLSLGLACCIVIGLFIQDEMSYDRHHENADRIYRVSQEVVRPGEEETWAWTGGGMAPDLAQDFPQIEAVARLLPSSGAIRYDSPDGSTVNLLEESFAYLDPQWFEMFTHPFVKGNPATAFDNPSGLVLTEEAARRYLGDREPLGQVVNYAGVDLTVTGVIEAIPESSHFTFEAAASIAAFNVSQGLPADDVHDSYWWPFGYTYVLLQDGADPKALGAALPDFAIRHREEGDIYIPRLEALPDLHLRSAAANGPRPAGSIQLVRIFAAIALVVLLLACINFMNLATARSARRAREVGVRKAVGAARSQLVGQFLGEAVVLSLISMVAAIGLVELALPEFNQIAARDLALNYVANGGYWLVLLGLVLATGVLAGSYPALYLSKFAPVKVLKGTFRAGGGNTLVRRGLVVFQFSISVVLIASTLIAVAQLRFMQSNNLGFDKDQTVRVRLSGVDYDLFQNQVNGLSSVTSVTSASTPPGLGGGSVLPYRSGLDIMEVDQSQDARMAHNMVEPNFLDQFGINLIAGRSFDEGRAADVGYRPDGQQWFHIYDRAFVVNEAAVRDMGLTPEEALGQKVRIYAFEGGTFYTDFRGEVVGVVEDFHYRSLRSRIDPMAFSLADTPQGHAGGFALVKVDGNGNSADVMSAIEGAWTGVAPGTPFEAAFLDEEIQALYLRESRLSRIIGWFTGLGIAIACLGLVGLATFAAEQRTKEIGVRKVMGASVPRLVGLLAKEFVRLVAIAFVLASPIAWFVMDRWLESFAYHIEPGFGVFGLTAVLALLVAVLSVSWQAFQAARANPVKSLRYE